MIKINYYDKQDNQLAQDVMSTGELSVELLILTWKKCALLGYYSFVAEDSNNNHIKEIVLKDEDIINDCDENLEQTRKAGGKCKPVAQYTKDGKFIQIWPSIREAGRHFNCVPGNISVAARKGCQSHGYFWKYAEV